MIQFTASAELARSLTRAGIALNEYKPAYGGEAVALDLYHASDADLVIPPIRGNSLLRGGDGFPMGVPDVNEDAFKVLVPTGLYLALPPDHAGLIVERSSITKTKLRRRAGLIDPGYTGQVFVAVMNLGGTPVTIKAHEKIPFQLIVLKCDTQFCYVPREIYDEITSTAKRKEACIGSTNVQETVKSATTEVAEPLASRGVREVL